MIQQATIRLAAACVLVPLSSLTFAAEPDFQVGFGRKKITPTESLWMSGYAGRRQASTGVMDDLYAQAMAVRDKTGNRALLLRVDVHHGAELEDLERLPVQAHPLLPEDHRPRTRSTHQDGDNQHRHREDRQRRQPPADPSPAS